MKRTAFEAKFNPPPEIEHLRSEVARLTQQKSENKRTTGQIKEAMDALRESVAVIPQPKLVCKPNADKSQTPVVHVLHCTDWHIGQVTNPEHVEEFGAFDFAIAQRRVHQLAEKFIAKTYAMRTHYRVDECHILGTADWVSGDIHEELVRTNEFPCPVQAVKSARLFAWLVSELSKHFEVVKVDALTAGNHDRITRKPQMEEGGINSWGYIAMELTKEILRENKRVEFKTHLALQSVVSVGGLRYLIAHGDGIMGTWGIPFYGIERKKQREAMTRMNMPTEKHFDRIVIGHFHTALNHEHWMIGGSLTGTGALDHKVGRHSKAHQTSWCVHPKGEFDWCRWDLE